MQEIKKLLVLSKHEYYETHLSIINCIIPNSTIKVKDKDISIKLTPTEAKVLAHFMALEGDIAKHRFGASAKKIIMQELELTPAGLSNHMNMLFLKGFLKKDDTGITILPILLPEKNEQFYRFKLMNNGTTE